MSNDETNRGERDRGGDSRGDLDEVKYFSRKLGVAQERVRQVIQKYGLSRPVCDIAIGRGYGPQCPAR